MTNDELRQRRIGFCEHVSIERALSSVGLDARQAWQGRADFASSTPAFFVAWSSRERLLRSPQWAWLSEPSVEFVRLPQPLGVLRDLFSRSVQPLRPSRRFIALTHPVGQFCWAVDRLQSAINERRTAEAEARIHELITFCRQHWPGWFERGFAKVGESFGANHVVRIEPVLGRFHQSAADVALASSLSPLFHGGNDDMINKGAGATLAAIRAVRSGMADFSYLRSVLSSTAWRGNVKNSLGQAIELVGCLEAIEHAPSFAISEPVRCAVEAVNRVDEFAENLLNGSGILHEQKSRFKDKFSVDILSAEQALGTLMQSVSELQAERDRLKRELQCDIPDKAADSIRR